MSTPACNFPATVLVPILLPFFARMTDLVRRQTPTFFALSLGLLALPFTAHTAGGSPREPLGQSSRRTSLVISEIMYHPAERADGKQLEFVELFNSLSTPEDISGWRLDGDADFVFPNGTVIPGRGFLVVAQAPDDLTSIYPLAGVLGPLSQTGNLPNREGTIRLHNRIGGVFLEARYGSLPPWPAAADGAGHSLVLARPSYGEGNVAAWAASDGVGGSPGADDPVTGGPLRHVLINEFLANSDPPDLDFIELYNHSNEPVDLSGCSLSDSPTTNKFVIAPQTVLAPRQFIAFTEDDLGFRLDSTGETIYFRDPANTRVLDAIRFGAQAAGLSYGRSPDGAPALAPLSRQTAGSANARKRLPDVVINEIMYHPPGGNRDDEFVELYNRTPDSVHLEGWRLSGGIDFLFPANTIIPPESYLVIARNRERLVSHYANLTPTNTIGDYDGALGDEGDRIVLEKPEIAISTNGGKTLSQVIMVTVNEVAYKTGGRWGQWSDGGGSSLELMDPRSDNQLPGNWADSDETAKAPWTTIHSTSVLAGGTSPADQLQVFLQGRGECLIDEVEVRPAGGANLIGNSTFENGAAGWTAEGTQEKSSLETSEGFQSARSYHIRAEERGDNQLNRIRTPLSAAQPAGSTNLIRAKVRWLRGAAEILFRLRGNWTEAAGALELPMNPGTPGARNSRALENGPPAISEVEHFPAVPAANQGVVVTARADDPDGVTSLAMLYRLDPNPSLISIPMRDDGTGGDAVAGDGLYSATIPGQAANALVAFQIQARDPLTPAAAGAFPADAPAHECLVRFGEVVPGGTFPAYTIWMTRATFNTWDARHNLNNSLNDITFVLGNSRVIYNAAAVYAGSPYIAPSFDNPTGRRCGYSLEFPPDDQFLGDTALVLDWPGGHGGENTAVQEQMAYWIADQMDLPFSHRYYIRLTVNGVTDMQRGGVFEAVLQPGRTFIEQWSPERPEGDFFKIDRAFEFNDAGNLIADPQPQLRVYTTPDLVHGGSKKKTETYRWMWLQRSFQSGNDYTNLFALADVLNSPAPEPYTSQTEALVDVEEWMGIFAVEHIINNFDSWGHDIGKNVYMFKPDGERFQIYLFDLDWLMLVAQGRYTAGNGPLFVSQDPTVTRMYNHPPFRRAYFRAVKKAVEQAFNPARYEPVMDAKYAALVANGITLCDGQGLAPPGAVKNWFSQRRAFLVSQLNAVAANFALTGAGGNNFVTSSNTIALTGTAPIEVTAIRVNGAPYPVRWTTVNNWVIRVAVAPGTSHLLLEALDQHGEPLAGMSAEANVTSSASPESPLESVVINEIMYHPVIPDAEFIELFNRSATTAFDLSGWRVEGVDFAFPAGTLIDPMAYLVLTKDAGAFGAAYGGTIPIAGQFSGQLDNGGETIKLIRPAPGPGGEQVVDAVSYDDEAPWPILADGTGPSLQLIDPSQDNSRVANWGVVVTSGPQAAEPQWQYVTATGPATTSRLYIYMTSAGDVYIDDLKLVAGAIAESGPNLVSNGDFESPFPAGWNVSNNLNGSSSSSAVVHSGVRSLHVVSSAAGSSASTAIWQDTTPLNTNATYTLSFWFLPSTNGTGLTIRLSGSGISAGPSIAPPPVPSSTATPGARNSTTRTIPSLPDVWVNEIQAINLTGPLDNAGEREPWIELYNAGSNIVSLDGWFLTDTYTNLARWSFPSGRSIAPRQFLMVWLDGEPEESSVDSLHASFRPPPPDGQVALVFPTAGGLAVLDYAKPLLAADRSCGLYPDGAPGTGQTFFLPTPAAPNHPGVAAPTVLINEWMAGNRSTLQDPADEQFDDWFELYNPNSVPIDLTGYSLADNLTNAAVRWSIPAGYSIQPKGFLLVWADHDPGQNNPAAPALHAPFRLSLDGEAIALFGPNGELIDAVVFGPQTNDLSQGRSPNGGPAFAFMEQPTPGTANLGSTGSAEIRIIGVALDGGTITLRWNSEAGKTYLVESADALEAAEWSRSSPITALEGQVSFTDPVPATRSRFYRVRRISE